MSARPCDRRRSPSAPRSRTPTPSSASQEPKLRSLGKPSTGGQTSHCTRTHAPSASLLFPRIRPDRHRTPEIAAPRTRVPSRGQRWHLRRRHRPKPTNNLAASRANHHLIGWRQPSSRHEAMRLPDPPSGMNSTAAETPDVSTATRTGSTERRCHGSATPEGASIPRASQLALRRHGKPCAASRTSGTLHDGADHTLIRRSGRVSILRSCVKPAIFRRTRTSPNHTTEPSRQGASLSKLRADIQAEAPYRFDDHPASPKGCSSGRAALITPPKERAQTAGRRPGWREPHFIHPAPDAASDHKGHPLR